MNRRTFLSVLGALPLVGPLFKSKAEVRTKVIWNGKAGTGWVVKTGRTTLTTEQLNEFVAACVKHESQQGSEFMAATLRWHIRRRHEEME